MPFPSRGNMTQSQFNIRVNSLYVKLNLLTSNVIDLKQSKDSYATQAEDRQKLLINVVNALSGYDLSTNILTDDQILTTLELGVLAGQSLSL
jgi:hypothetical protein